MVINPLSRKLFSTFYSFLSSLTSKVTNDGSSDIETVDYTYNLQNRLSKIITDDQSGTVDVVEYTYNDNGIRVKAYSYNMPQGGGAKSNEETTTYLIDPYNHTGYAQVLEETTGGVRKTYTIGDDVVTQYEAGTGAEQLLYDGHGSTRQLVTGSVGSTAIVDDFSYDGYGVLLQDSSATPGYTPEQNTSLLYAGEMFDFDSQHYYNRARWYNPYNGRFNRTDPYAGNMQDPQSLHKYLYCHANPINGIDPTGRWNISDALMVIGLGITIIGVTLMVAAHFTNNELMSDIGWELCVLGAIVVSAGGTAAFELMTAAHALATVVTTTSLGILYSLMAGGLKQIYRGSLSPTAELSYLVRRMGDEGIPKNAFIIFRDRGSISQYEEDIRFIESYSLPPAYEAGDKVLSYSVHENSKTTVTIEQFEVTSVNPFMSETITEEKEIEVNALSAGLFQDSVSWKWALITRTP